jgi:hypothetical protein
VKRFDRFAGLCFGAFLAVLMVAPPASAADLILDYADPGPCGDERVLRRVVESFRYQVRNVPDLPNVNILDFTRIHERRYLPEQDRWPIGRLYCGAMAHLSSGDERPVWYLIEEGMGFASIGAKVFSCVLGFDPWYVYDGDCRVLREPPPPLPNDL